MWTKTTQAKFEEYGIMITTQRQLLDGEYIMHMERTDFPEFIINSRNDLDVKWYTNEEMQEILALEEPEVIQPIIEGE